MKKKPASKSAFFNQRVLIGFSFCLIGLVLALAAFNAYPGGNAFARQPKAAIHENQSSVDVAVVENSVALSNGDLAQEVNPDQSIPQVPFAYTEKAPYPTFNGLSRHATASFNNFLYVIGGESLIGAAFAPTTAVQRFDPVANTWAVMAPLPTAVSNHEACAMNGKIYVPGGYGGSGPPFSNINYIYDITSNTWSTGAVVPAPATLWAVVACDASTNRVYVLGGFDGTVGTTTTKIYDATANTWSAGAVLPEARYGADGGLIAGNIYVAGGANPAGTAATTLYRYAIATNTWSAPLAPMTVGCLFGAAGVDTSNRLWITGGGFCTNAATVTGRTESYDPVANAWTTTPDVLNETVRHTNGGFAGSSNTLFNVVAGFNTTSILNTQQLAVAGGASPTPSASPSATATPSATPSPSASASPGGVPANDLCAGAIVIPPAGPFPFLTSAVNVTNATITGDPPLPSCQTSVSRSIWYTFTPSVTGSYTISSCQTEAPACTLPDDVLTIYTSAAGCAGPFTQLPTAGCDDDTCTTLALQAIIANTTLTAGTQYYILAYKFGTTIPTAGADSIQFRVAFNGAVSPTPTPTPSPSGTPSPTATPSPGFGCSVINGGLNPQPLTESGVAAPAGFFWSEVQHDAGNTTQSNTNAGYAAFQGTTRLADNFTISQTCTINNIVLYGYLTGAPATPSPFTATTLQIWNGRPGDAGAAVIFGDTTTNRLASSVDSTFFRIFNTVVPPPGTLQGTTRKIWKNTITVGTTLPPGTYWIDWASTVSTAVNHFYPSKTIPGARGAAGDNARQFATGAWTDAVDAGNPAGGTPVPQDFPFEVNGAPLGGTPSPSPSPGTPTPTPSASPTPSPCGVNTFSNTGAITIPATGTGATTGAPALPYPSNIAVAGLTGTITKVTVRLNNLGHTFPDDIDILLVGPAGQQCFLMSDNGGDLDVTGVTLTFDDAAAASLPDGNSLVSGTFKPSNVGGADAFPAPAPAPGANILLSVFNGTAPNGTWALYVVDDAGIDIGAIANGWDLNISTTTGSCPSPTPGGTPTPSPSVSPSPCPGGTNVILDGTFEAGSPWTAWTVQTSTNFGTPMCDAACGTGGGTAGGFGGSANWAWFGGIAAPETATTGQSVVIASGGSASLTFQLWIGAVNTPFTDVLNVRVDGTIVASFVEPAVAEPGYTLRTVDVGAFANGASHAILFEYIGTSALVSNFSVDNVSLIAGGVCATPTPSATIAPSATPSATIAPSATPSATIAPSATPSATIAPSATPTATVGVSPSPTPGGGAQAVNLSTRMRVQTGDRVGIAGFIITGGSKTVLLRAIGPSLTRYKIEDVLADPILELHGPAGFTTVINDNWRVPNGAAIQATGIPPTNDLESAILATLAPGQYTGIIKGVGNTSGVGLVEVYDLTPNAGTLANISTRAFVSTGDNIVIAGFVLDDGSGNGSSAPGNVIIRGMGPSLTAAGVTNVLADPTLELRDGNGSLLISNNDWQDNPAQAALISGAGLAPSNSLESAIAATVPPGLYTALLAGLNNTTGNGLVEVYDRGAAGGGPIPTPTPPGGTPTPAPSPSPGVSPSPVPSPSPGATPTPTPPPASPTPSPIAGDCIENFDGPPPALPTGWTAELAAGDPPTWETTLGSPDGANGANAFVDDQDGKSEKRIVSRNITVNSAASVLSFRNNYNTEYDPPPAEVFWDGYVLDVSTDGGANWNDIITAGGTCTAGCYTGEITGTANNPLAGRQAWCGDSGGYINTVINMPASLNGQTIKVRFVMGTDEALARPGAHVDVLTITNASCP